MSKSTATQMPARFKRPSIFVIIGVIFFFILMIGGIQSADISLERLAKAFKHLMKFLDKAFPPDFEDIWSITVSIYHTMEMAVVGTVIGVMVSLPVAIFAADNLASNQWLSRFLKGMVVFFRTIPDLVFALIFVITLGIGPLAGIATIIVDTIGFCGRFFTERIEEMDDGPIQALESTGASRFGVIVGSVIPMGMPSFVGTSLFATEKSIRSSTILGLVGAGGIGVELNAAMSLRQFDEAATIILMILVVVVLFERLSALVRKRFL